MGWHIKSGRNRFRIKGWGAVCRQLGLREGHVIELGLDPADRTRLLLSVLPAAAAANQLPSSALAVARSAGQPAPEAAAEASSPAEVPRLQEWGTHPPAAAAPHPEAAPTAAEEHAPVSSAQATDASEGDAPVEGDAPPRTLYLLWTWVPAWQASQGRAS